ncbi:hypothetical protein SLS60_002928 [Paraconiothyrium brasiliense]|uniref:F-box domain-containing protein n=1 Tax=Paraconiothyrium brasiliense TaxID=300254 RepID=A0ABR3RU73_9PLEO
MDSVPRETLDLILKQLLAYHHPITERFAKITEDSKEDLLNARLVCRGFWASKSLQDAFGRVLGEIPLFREDLRLDRFEAISQSKYADKMATLTFPGILVLGWSDEQLCVFKSKLCRLFYDFPHVENLRISHEGLEEPVDPRDFPRWAKGLIFHLVLEFQTPEITTRSVEFPLEGLAAWSYSVLAYRDLSGLKFLTRLSVNLTTGTYRPILERGLFGCQNLEFLEIALGVPIGITIIGHDLWMRGRHQKTSCFQSSKPSG